MIQLARKKPEGRRIPDPISETTEFAVTEAYKMLRTNLVFSLTKKGCKRVLITSGNPREGKSITCVNLAVTLAQTNSRVLLIDCDLRKSVVHKIMKLKSVPGISDFLGGMCEFRECFRDTTYPNLKVICAGTIPPNPGELLGSEGMKSTLDALEESFDYILLDTPPVNMVSDALGLSRYCDGVLVVVKHNQTLKPELTKTISHLKFVEARVLGLVMNGKERSNRLGYGSYHKKYGYDYDYNYKPDHETNSV